MRAAFHLLTFLAIVAVGGMGLVSSAAAQTIWKDKTGKFQVTGQLEAFNSQLVIVKTDDGELLSIAIDDLSEENQQFLQSEEAEAIYGESNVQRWTLRNGLQFLGQLVSHDVRDITLQRRRGKLYLNDRPVENLPVEYQKLLPAAVGLWEGQELNDLEAMEKWLYSRYGYRPKTYQSEGVRMAMKNGDELVLPYVVFADADRKFLEQGGKAYREAEAEERQNQELYMQVRAEEYQRSQDDAAAAQAEQQRQRQEDLQIKRVQLGLLGVAADVTDLWQVAMVPPGGNIYQAQLVVVPARDSRQASQMASAKWPGYVVGPVRKLNRNF